MSKLPDIDAAKQNLSSLWFADGEARGGLEGKFDAFVERKACSAEMIGELANMLEIAFDLGKGRA